MRRRDVPGTCYLLHFDRPYRHAAHYLGWTSNLSERLDAHARGEGARLLAVIRNEGIDWTLARIWEGATRAQERQLKRRGGHARLCPLCRPARPE